MFSLTTAIAIIALATADQAAVDALQKRATWQPPAAEAVKAEIDRWLESSDADETTRARVDLLWSEELSAAFSEERLDRLAATLALVDAEARALVECCAAAQRPLTLPTFELLDRPDTPALVRNNLRLYFARWLAQHQLYDETLIQIGDLKPADVIDPATLLFYQSVAHHRLMDKDKCLPLLETLLENRGQIPKRYETLALLMEADIKPLKTDSLDEVARLMDDVERRLGLGRAGQRVRQQEDEVIAKLDKMIEEIEKQMQQSQGAAGATGGAQPAQPMQDSSPAGGSGPGEVQQRNTGARSGWGNLPPKKRQEALQQIAKGLPSHYREVIEEYFRKLARDGN